MDNPQPSSSPSSTAEAGARPTIGRAYGEPPYHYSRDIELNVLFATTAEAVAPLLPPPLRLGDRATGYLRVVRHRLSPFGPYTGAYLGVVADFEGRTVGHMLTGVKTDFAGAAAGREVWGMPLQLGEVDMAWHGEVLGITVRRSGAELARVSVQLEARAERTGRPTLATFASAADPAVDGAGMRLVGVESEGDPTGSESWSAAVRIAPFGGTPTDDWSAIPVGRVLRASVLVGGRILLPRGRTLARWGAA